MNAIAWAPHELGPILACASSDGKVSVLTFNSSFFSLQILFSSQRFQFLDDGTWDASLFPAHSSGVTSVTWSPAVGTGSLTSLENHDSVGLGGLKQVKRFATGGCDGLVRMWTWMCVLITE